MKQAVLITVYKDCEHLVRLINKLSVFCAIYVHIDKKSRQLYKDVKRIYGDVPCVTVVSKYRVKWGGYNHLRAVVYLMQLVSRNSDVKYIHVISGQDYPVADMKRFSEFDECNKVYMTCRKLTETNDNILMRYAVLHFCAPYLDLRSDRYHKLDNHFSCGRKRIGALEVRDLYKGMIWASMPIDVCKYVLSFIRSKNGRGFYYGLKYSEIPEEVFFQSIIMHSKYRDLVVCDNLRYTLWQEKNGSSPGILDDSDYEFICNSNAVFARKIDSDYSNKLINLIDKERQNGD